MGSLIWSIPLELHNYEFPEMYRFSRGGHVADFYLRCIASLQPLHNISLIMVWTKVFTLMLKDASYGSNDAKLKQTKLFSRRHIHS
uniref:Uncharacterized protein n=1 Tax=Engystomops pustulosus TaxID=76066 RepID=A0AAV6YSY6_ENGPU|nr:hypothetical protein GDO81_020351 [Engystomops pustulosus]